MFHPTMAGRRILWKPLRLRPVAAPTITATKVMPSSRGISSSNLRFTAPDKPPSDKLKVGMILHNVQVLLFVILSPNFEKND